MSVNALELFLMLLSSFSTFALQVDKDAPSNLALKRSTGAPLSSSTTFQTGPDGISYMAAVPNGDGPFPVVVLLHEVIHSDLDILETLRGFVNLFDTTIRTISVSHILVAPVGFSDNGEYTWNIKNELSKRDDVGLIAKTFIDFLSSFTNVMPTFKFVGFSNGAGLTNRIIIENDDPRITCAVTCGSQLNLFQCHDGAMYIGGNDNSYLTPKQSLHSRRVLQITGEKDIIVKADGTQGKAPETFLAWDDSAYELAVAFGYSGAKLDQSSFDGFVGLNFLDGQVQAYNFQNITHDPRFMWSPVKLLEDFLQPA